MKGLRLKVSFSTWTVFLFSFSHFSIRRSKPTLINRGRLDSRLRPSSRIRTEIRRSIPRWIPRAVKRIRENCKDPRFRQAITRRVVEGNTCGALN